VVEFPGISGFSGTPAQFNATAAKIIHGEHVAELLPSVPDYFYQLVDQNLIRTSSAVNHGCTVEGSTQTSLNTTVTGKGSRLIKQWRHRPKRG
jgi:hypothetical protein